MEPITITLPYPPSDNEKYVGRTKKVLSPVVNAYRRAVETLVLERRVPRITVDVEAFVILHPANDRRDSSNCLKVLWDTLEHVGILRNDRQVKNFHVYRGNKHPSDVIEVRFTDWGGPVPDDPQEIAEMPNTYVTSHDLASIRYKIPAFDRTPFRKRKGKQA